METTTNTTAIVRIHRPDLTEEERAKRMEAIKAAATRLLTAVARQQATENKRRSRGILYRTAPAGACLYDRPSGFHCR